MSQRRQKRWDSSLRVEAEVLFSGSFPSGSHSLSTGKGCEVSHHWRRSAGCINGSYGASLFHLVSFEGCIRLVNSNASWKLQDLFPENLCLPYRLYVDECLVVLLATTYTRIRSIDVNWSGSLRSKSTIDRIHMKISLSFSNCSKDWIRRGSALELKRITRPTYYCLLPNRHHQAV